MSRLELADTLSDIIITMSNGNPGAMTALVDLCKNSSRIDPQSAFGPLASILDLDRLEIYGTDIYVLWNDICDREVNKMIALLRANQLGILSDELLKDLSSRQDRSGVDMINVEDIYIQVRKQLDQFDKILVEEEV